MCQIEFVACVAVCNYQGFSTQKEGGGGGKPLNWLVYKSKKSAWPLVSVNPFKLAGPVIKTMDIVASFYSNCIFVFQFCVAYSFLFFLKALVSGISCTKILGCGSRITVNTTNGQFCDGNTKSGDAMVRLRVSLCYNCV